MGNLELIETEDEKAWREFRECLAGAQWNAQKLGGKLRVYLHVRAEDMKPPLAAIDLPRALRTDVYGDRVQHFRSGEFAPDATLIVIDREEVRRKEFERGTPMSANDDQRDLGTY